MITLARNVRTLGVALALGAGVIGWLAFDRLQTADVKPAGAAPRTQAGRAQGIADTAPKTRVAARLELDLLERPRKADKSAGLFSAGVPWNPPPPVVEKKPEPPPPPPAPVAPPLPFGYFGKMTEKGQTMVFLSMGDDTLVAKAGDSLRQTYKVETIDANGIVFTYIPLNQKQTLPLPPGP